MIAGTVAQQESLRQIVRGERTLAELSSIGITLRRQGDRWQVVNPRGVSLTLSIHDLAKGLLAHRPDAAALRQWAMLIQAADLDIDAESHSQGDEMLSALWDAAFGNPIQSSALQTLEQLSRQP